MGEGIVLSMITFNSTEKVGREVFRRVWESSLQVPYESIILVDDSTTGDVRSFVKSFAREHGKELIVERSKLYGYRRPTRATARQTAIDIFMENFSEEWLMFLDDDFVLSKGWWSEAKGYTGDERVGIIWGINWDAGSERERSLRPLRVSVEDYLVEAFKVRGGLHDALLRRRALAGMPRIPPSLHVYEDAWVYWALTCKGWQYRIVRRGGLHYNPFIETKVDINQIIEAYRYGFFDKLLISRGLHEEYKSVLLSALLVLRPMIGFIYYLPWYFPRGLWKLAYRQYVRTKIRYYLLKARIKYGPPPHPCKAIYNKY